MIFLKKPVRTSIHRIDLRIMIHPGPGRSYYRIPPHTGLSNRYGVVAVSRPMIIPGLPLVPAGKGGWPWFMTQYPLTRPPAGPSQDGANRGAGASATPGRTAYPTTGGIGARMDRMFSRKFSRQSIEITETPFLGYGRFHHKPFPVRKRHNSPGSRFEHEMERNNSTYFSEAAPGYEKIVTASMASHKTARSLLTIRPYGQPYFMATSSGPDTVLPLIKDRTIGNGSFGGSGGMLKRPAKTHSRMYKGLRSPLNASLEKLSLQRPPAGGENKKILSATSDELYFHKQRTITEEIRKIRQTMIETKEIVTENRPSSPSSTEIEKVIAQHLDMHRISDQVYQTIERRIRMERERRGR